MAIALGLAGPRDRRVGFPTGRDATCRRAARREAIRNADIRVHSLGAANAYGFRPMSDAGKRFVDAHAAMVKGHWQDGIFWFHDCFMPRAALDATALKVVAGTGDTDEHDSLWHRNPFPPY